PPRSPRFPYTTLFRSQVGAAGAGEVARRKAERAADRVAGGKSEAAVAIAEDDFERVRAAVGDRDVADAVTVEVGAGDVPRPADRSEEHTSELQSRFDL